MAVTSTRVITVNFSGDGLNGAFTFSATSNAVAPGAISILTLPTGSTVVAFPTGGSTVYGATIIPPTGNTSTITVKGTTADVGVAIHKTDPTSIAFDTTSTTQTGFTITVSSTVTGLRVVWT